VACDRPRVVCRCLFRIESGSRNGVHHHLGTWRDILAEVHGLGRNGVERLDAAADLGSDLVEYQRAGRLRSDAVPLRCGSADRRGALSSAPADCALAVRDWTGGANRVYVLQVLRLHQTSRAVVHGADRLLLGRDALAAVDTLGKILRMARRKAESAAR